MRITPDRSDHDRVDGIKNVTDTLAEPCAAPKQRQLADIEPRLSKADHQAQRATEGFA